MVIQNISIVNSSPKIKVWAEWSICSSQPTAHSRRGGGHCRGNAANTKRKPQTFRQPSEWRSVEAGHASTQGSVALPRPSITLPLSERQIVRAISGGAKKEDCSPALERRRKWLPASRHCWQHHTQTHSPQTHSLHFIVLSVKTGLTPVTPSAWCLHEHIMKCTHDV